MRGIPDCIFLCIEQGHLFSIIILQCPDLSFVWVEVLIEVLVIVLYYIIILYYILISHYILHYYTKTPRSFLCMDGKCISHSIQLFCFLTYYSHGFIIWSFIHVFNYRRIPPWNATWYDCLVGMPENAMSDPEIPEIFICKCSVGLFHDFIPWNFPLWMSWIFSSHSFWTIWLFTIATLLPNWCWVFFSTCYKDSQSNFLLLSYDIHSFNMILPPSCFSGFFTRED